MDAKWRHGVLLFYAKAKVRFKKPAFSVPENGVFV